MRVSRIGEESVLTQSNAGRPWRDLLFWFLAYVLAAALENIVLVRGFGISADVAVFGSKPQIWIARFLQPLTVLSILTFVLWSAQYTLSGISSLIPCGFAISQCLTFGTLRL